MSLLLLKRELFGVFSKHHASTFASIWSLPFGHGVTTVSSLGFAEEEVEEAHQGHSSRWYRFLDKMVCNK